MPITRPTRCAEAGASARHRLRRLAVAIGIACASAPAGFALAQTVKLTPGIGTQLTWTNNVNLAPRQRAHQRPGVQHHARACASTGRRRARRCRVTSPRPSISMRAPARRTTTSSRRRTSSAPGPSSRTSSSSTRPPSSSRRTTTPSVRDPPISPMRRTTASRLSRTRSVRTSRADSGNISYLLRDDNQWIMVDNAPGGNDFQYTNHLFGTIERTPLAWGWGADIDRNRYRFDTQGGDAAARARTIARHLPAEPDLARLRLGGLRAQRVSADRLRWNDLWRRIPLAARADDRARRRLRAPLLRHVLPRQLQAPHAAVRVGVQRLAQHQHLSAAARDRAGGNVHSRRAERDPAARGFPIPSSARSSSSNFMDQRNLPAVLAEPVTLYSQRITLNQNATATAGLLGVRNSRLRQRLALPDQPDHGLRRRAAAAARVDRQQCAVGRRVRSGTTRSRRTRRSRPASRTATPKPRRRRPTRPRSTRRGWCSTRTIGPNTRGYAGMRWQQFDSDVSSNYSEFAVFLGLTHTFN